MSKTDPKFVFLNDMPLGRRTLFIFIFAAIGLGLQIFASLAMGWIAIVIAAAFGAMVGRSNEPAVIGSGEWQPVTVEEIEKMQQLLTDSSSVRNTNYELLAFGGCLLITLGMLGIVALITGSSADIITGPIMNAHALAVGVITDIIILFAAIVLSGSINAWEPPNIRKKFEQINSVIDAGKSSSQLELQPNLQFAKTDNGMVPVDYKLMVKIKGAAPDFIGIQLQTTYNMGQPYTYCVILAKPEFRMLERTSMIEMPPPGGFRAGFLGLGGDANFKREAKFPRYKGSLVEMKHEGEVDVAVVRQDTSKGTKGYVTTTDQVFEVFSNACTLAQSMLQGY